MSLTAQQILNAQRTADYDTLCAKREQLEQQLIEGAKAASLLKRAFTMLEAAGFHQEAASVDEVRTELDDAVGGLDDDFCNADAQAEEMAENLSCPACGKFNCEDRICLQANRNNPGPEEDHHA